MTVPPAVTAATGVDALAHCVEAFTSRKAHPLIDLYALEGIRLVGRYLAARGGRRRRSRGARRAGAGLALWRLLPRPGEHDGRPCRRLSARHAAPCRAWPRLRGDLPAYAGLQRAGGAGRRRSLVLHALGLPERNVRGGCVRCHPSLLRRSRHRDAAVRARRAAGTISASWRTRPMPSAACSTTTRAI